MRYLFVVSGALLFFLLPIRLFAQVVHWDGGGGDSLWSNPLNWSNDQLPSSADEVWLNNQWISGDYSVVCPGGTLGIAVRSLQIQPTVGRTIELTIPFTLVAVPALTVSAAPGIVIGAGGVLRNLSGAPSGTTLQINDSLRVLNGGRYIHQTETAHATLLNRLSRAPETAEGIFQFNVPGPASYTLSVSNRTYGSLIISAAAAGGSKTYLSSGSNPLLVRGNLTLDAGVNYAMNFSGNCRIAGDLEVNGILNLSSGSAAARCVINGGIAGRGTITETGSSSAIVALEGGRLHRIRFSGQWQQQVELQLNDIQGAELEDSLQLPYRFQLITGSLQTSDTALLILGSICSLQADSMQPAAFINGPLLRKGLHPDSTYMFPVGKGGRQRWFRLQQATGDYRIEYFRDNPKMISGRVGNGLTHISAMEYWKLEPATPSSLQARVSFELASSGGVTDLQSLRVTRLRDTVWEDAGNTGVTGTAGGSGSVTSALLDAQPTVPAYFTLASSGAAQNPLPVRWIQLEATDQGNRVELKARVKEEDGYPFRFEYSTNGQLFLPLVNTAPIWLQGQYTAFDSSHFQGSRMYRLLIRQPDGGLVRSEVIRLARANRNGEIVLSGGSWTPTGPTFTAQLPRAGNYTFQIIGMNGLLLYARSIHLAGGKQTVRLPADGQPAGIYTVIAVSQGYRSNTLRLVKR